MQELIADLHIHSRFSRATSRDGDGPHLDLFARRKGIGLLGTGDITHPAWREELRACLRQEEGGLYTLREQLRLPGGPGGTVRFVPTGEISCIYKKNGRTRKVHLLLILPTLEDADRLAQRLEAVGNIRSDGRPILGMDSRDLLELALESCPQTMCIPAHIWTPHFSVFGAFSGFQTMEECFEDLTGEIHGVETGLSSDPPMNWRVSALDRYALLSHSDAHSPAKLGREANLLREIEEYAELKREVETGDGMLGTVEFFPEEGKYHLDGHRPCKMRLKAEEAMANGGRCPVCGARLTIGVEHRVNQLADRPAGFRPTAAKPFERLVPLQEALGNALGTGPESAKAQTLYEKCLQEMGPEFHILRKSSIEEIARVAGAAAAEAIRRMRNGEVLLEPGYDGVYGKVQLLTAEDRARLAGQTSFLAAIRRESEPKPSLLPAMAPKAEEQSCFGTEEDEAQREAILSSDRAIAVTAGPGSGKTRTLVAKVCHLIREEGVSPGAITAVTFTHQAALEMRERLEKELGGRKALSGMTIGTFHAVCLAMLPTRGVLGEVEAQRLMGQICAETGSSLDPGECLERFATGEPIEEPLESLHTLYRQRLAELGLRDMDGVLLDALEMERWPEQKFQYLFVDEFQDINGAQRRLVQKWSKGGRMLFAIGDPDQSIYGFRGASAACFSELKRLFPHLRSLSLARNYRSTPQICMASERLISHNPGGNRILAARRPEGVPVRFLQADTPFAEAVAVAKEIVTMTGGMDMLEAQRLEGSRESHRSFSEIAVLARTHRQLELIENCLLHEDIPVLVAGRSLFWQDKRVLQACSALLCLWRGEDTGDFEPEAGKWKPVRLMERWICIHGGSEELTRLRETAACYSSLAQFCQEALLGPEADVRRYSGGKIRSSGAVRLMTIHGAKGLEFPVVFLSGLTQGVFPSSKASMEQDLQEERRLLFVGMTRARDELVLSGAQPLSPFVAELPAEVEHRQARPVQPAARQLCFWE